MENKKKRKVGTIYKSSNNYCMIQFNEHSGAEVLDYVVIDRDILGQIIKIERSYNRNKETDTVAAISFIGKVNGRNIELPGLAPRLGESVYISPKKLIKEIFVAKKALAAYLIICADFMSVTKRSPLMGWWIFKRSSLAFLLSAPITIREG